MNNIPKAKTQEYKVDLFKYIENSKAIHLVAPFQNQIKKE